MLTKKGVSACNYNMWYVHTYMQKYRSLLESLHKKKSRTRRIQFQDSISLTKAPPRLPTIPDLKCLALIPSCLYYIIFPFLSFSEQAASFHDRFTAGWHASPDPAISPVGSTITVTSDGHRKLLYVCSPFFGLLPGGISFPISPPRSSISSYFLFFVSPFFLVSTHNISVKSGCCFQPKNGKKTPGQVTLFSEILPAHARNRVVLPTPGGPRRSIAFSSPMRSCWESHVPLKQIHELGTQVEPNCSGKSHMFRQETRILYVKLVALWFAESWSYPKIGGKGQLLYQGSQPP